ncbi:hypothetical protein MKEN_00710400 [Mycena kentingensis (nom. inval.)]|nr:hypothetical protein MKEN_00710400 [Mycena kentingensis (nom. inval.)]
MAPQNQPGDGGESGGGGRNRRPPPPPFSSSVAPSSSTSTIVSSAGSSIASSTIAKSSNSGSPTGQVMAASTQTAQSGSYNMGLIIGVAVGGMVVGAIAVLLIVFCIRRRSRRRQILRLSSQQLVVTDEGLIEKGMLPEPFPLAPPDPAGTSKVNDWMQRNRDRVSVSTISSFSSPTVLGSDTRTSISTYSQRSGVEDAQMANRPPGLDRITEHE